MEIKHLRLIDAIGKEGSLQKAAEILHLTPSALSHQLKELEAQLGTPVFYRTHNRLQFTPAG
ncbi:MAG TPA: SAM-dependent methyltransferase, partial [Cytophagales bacterium]|nr:SAM-dependent methyltransferase [Cytophagales bacterium]